MECTRVRNTDLARNTSQVILKVPRGQTAVMESHGGPEAALQLGIPLRVGPSAVNELRDEIESIKKGRD